MKMSSLSRAFRRSAVISAIAFALAACVPDLEAGRVAERVPTPDAAARAGGRLVVATGPIAGIDPVAVQEPASHLVVGTICDQLITLDPMTGEPRPSIARSWTVAQRGTKLFLRLRRDVRFHNGRALVAEDVRYSLTRLASEEEASPSASLVEPIAGYAFVHGDEETDDDRFRRALVGVTVIDPHSLEITLDGEASDWLRALAHPATSPVPREAVERDPAGFARRPICTGPYRVAAPVEPGEPVRVVRFREHHGGNAAYTRGGRGWVDEIVFRPFAGRAAEERALVAGTVDVAHRPEAATAALRGAREVVAPTAQVEYIGLPTSREPFDDPNVRVALSMAIDRAAIARAVYGNVRAPARAFVPPALVAEHRAGACGEAAPPTAAVAAARARLARSGVSLKDATISITYNDEHRNRALVSAVAAAWERAFGARVRAVAVPWERLLDLGTRARGADGPFRFGWAPAYASADEALAPLFHVDGIGRNNLSRFGSRAFNDAIRDARRATGAGERRQAYQRAEDVLCGEMPMIPIVVAARRIAFRTGVASAVATDVHRVDAEPLLRELYITR